MWDYQDDFVAFLEGIGWSPKLNDLVEGKIPKQIVMLGHSMVCSSSLLHFHFVDLILTHLTLVL